MFSEVSVAVLLGLSMGFLLAQLDGAEPVMIALAFPGSLGITWHRLAVSFFQHAARKLLPLCFFLTCCVES